MSLKPVWAATEEECVGDVRRQFISAPVLQHRMSFSPSQAAGGVSLAWHRGHQAGVHDAYLTLKKDHPRAAFELREAFGMSEDGAIRADV